MVGVYGFSVSGGADGVVLRPSKAARLMALPQLVAMVVLGVGIADAVGEAPLVAGALIIWLGWITWDVCCRLLGRVTLAAGGVTVQVVRRRTIS